MFTQCQGYWLHNAMLGQSNSTVSFNLSISRTSDNSVLTKLMEHYLVLLSQALLLSGRGSGMFTIIYTKVGTFSLLLCI